MNARFAEVCRTAALEFSKTEYDIYLDSVADGRSREIIGRNCEKDIYIGLFFDGTNTNKYRDTPGYSQSNVARLYEVFPGTPARQMAPTFRPRVLPDGSTQPRLPFPDAPFKAASVAPDDFPYYRKIYLPGLGTPMPDVGDSGSGLDRAFEKLVDQKVRSFHEDIRHKYHRLTHAFIGNHSDNRAYGAVTWTSDGGS